MPHTNIPEFLSLLFGFLVAALTAFAKNLWVSNFTQRDSCVCVCVIDDKN